MTPEPTPEGSEQETRDRSCYCFGDYVCVPCELATRAAPESPPEPEYTITHSDAPPETVEALHTGAKLATSRATEACHRCGCDTFYFPVGWPPSGPRCTSCNTVRGPSDDGEAIEKVLVDLGRESKVGPHPDMDEGASDRTEGWQGGLKYAVHKVRAAFRTPGETERLRAVIAKAVRHIVEKDYDKALTALTVGRVWASPTGAEPDEEGLTFLGEGPLRRKLKEIGEGKDFGTLTIAPLVAQSILHRLHWSPTGAEPTGDRRTHPETET